MNSSNQTRKAIESIHGQVWDEAQLSQEFTITAIIVPGQVVVVRKADGMVGSMTVQHGFYFNFQPAPSCES